MGALLHVATLPRMKPEEILVETLVEACSNSDVQVNRQIWV